VITRDQVFDRYFRLQAFLQVSRARFELSKLSPDLKHQPELSKLSPISGRIPKIQLPDLAARDKRWLVKTFSVQTTEEQYA
jgi:hypothetical protein